ncbi:MAG: hypothetical protein IPH07_31970 [Deltaproteobacteria bacterium]|nr:hypothetical protein [Deltaproteobacteria bacterium]
MSQHVPRSSPQRTWLAHAGRQAPSTHSSSSSQHSLPHCTVSQAGPGPVVPLESGLTVGSVVEVVSSPVLLVSADIVVVSVVVGKVVVPSSSFCVRSSRQPKVSNERAESSRAWVSRMG